VLIRQITEYSNSNVCSAQKRHIPPARSFIAANDIRRLLDAFCKNTISLEDAFSVLESVEVV
jgi:hypothetical protein